MSTKLTAKLLKRVQAFLITIGHDDNGSLVANGNIVGNNGESTRNALQAFQRMHGLEATSELNEDTLAWMADDSYEPVRNERDPIRMVQAAMILSGLDYDGMLFANGTLDEPTRERLAVFIALKSMRDHVFTLPVTEDDDKPAVRLPKAEDIVSDD